MYKLKELAKIPRTHIKSRVCLQSLIEETETGGFLEFAVQLA